jgi:hypothetical protein
LEGGEEVSRYEARLRGLIVRVDGGELTRDEVKQLINSAVAELELLKAEEIDVSTNLRTGAFTLTISVDSADLPSAQETAGCLIRTAFHAAGAGTPDWSVTWIDARIVPEGELLSA